MGKVIFDYVGLQADYAIVDEHCKISTLRKGDAVLYHGHVAELVELHKYDSDINGTTIYSWDANLIGEYWPASPEFRLTGQTTIQSNDRANWTKLERISR